MSTIERTTIDGGYEWRCAACGWRERWPEDRPVRHQCAARGETITYLPDGWAEQRAERAAARDAAQQRRPSLLRRAANFARESVRHVARGRPQASDEAVAARFAACASCELYEPLAAGHGRCLHSSCGCHLRAVGLSGLNKLRWADAACPLGRWGAVAAHEPPLADDSAGGA